MKQSSLVETFREARKHLAAENHLENRTSRHSRPDMTKTRERLANHIKAAGVNQYVSGRKANYIIPNLFEKGTDVLSVLETMGLEALSDLTDPSLPEDGEPPEISHDDVEAVM